MPPSQNLDRLRVDGGDEGVPAVLADGLAAALDESREALEKLSRQLVVPQRSESVKEEVEAAAHGRGRHLHRQKKAVEGVDLLRPVVDR